MPGDSACAIAVGEAQILIPAAKPEINRPGGTALVGAREVCVADNIFKIMRGEVGGRVGDLGEISCLHRCVGVFGVEIKYG